MSTSSIRSAGRGGNGASGEILSHIKISQIYCKLTGIEPRPTGPDKCRGPAVWRNGDGYNVSMDDSRGVWYDFVSGEGGGIIDLVVRVHGGSRQDALRWTADLVGCRLDDRPPLAADRARWAKQQRQIERELPKARRWRRMAIALGEEILDVLKAALIDPTLPRPAIGEIAQWTARLAAWRQLDDAGLVAEYVWWARHEPHLTDGLEYLARLRAAAERRALLIYLTIVATGKDIDSA